MRLFCILILLSVNGIVSFGQVIPTSTTIHTPQGNVKTTSYHNMLMVTYGRSGRSVSAKSKYEFTVRLKNDSTFRVKTMINSSTNKHFITVVKNKRRIDISPAETKFISHISKYNGYTINGIPTDSCWLFMVDRGKINSYSFIPDEVALFIVAIQKGDGPIVPLTKKDLREMVGEDPKVLKLIENDDLLEAVNVYNKK